jgi:hypothetical protein
MTGHTDWVHSAAFSPNGLKIVSASEDLDKTVRVWDMATSNRELTMQGHTGGVMSVGFSPDGLKIVSASYDTTVRVWDATSGRRVWDAASGRRVWDAAVTSDCEQTMEGHTGVVYGWLRAGDDRAHQRGVFGRIQPGWSEDRVGERRQDSAGAGRGERELRSDDDRAHPGAPRRRFGPSPGLLQTALH